MTLTATPSQPFLATVGQDVDLLSASTEYTVAQAAKFLRMSERHVNDLLDAGYFVFRQENGLRLIRQDSLLAFEEERERGHAALNRMIRWNQEMGLYDD